MPNRFLIATLIAAAGAVMLHLVVRRRIAKQKLRQIYRNTAAAAALFALLAVLAEVATRMIYPEIQAGSDAPAFFTQFSDPPVSIIKNRFGFREREFTLSPRKGIMRIAVIGDSITAGHGLPVRARLTEKLEAQLNQDGEFYEVLNFGIAGNETVDHLETLKSVLKSMHPDFILMQWFVNDLEGHERTGRPKYLRLVPSSRIRRFLADNSVLYAVATDLWRNLQLSLGLADHYWDYMTDRFAEAAGADYRTAEKDLEEVFRLAADANVPIGMVLFPEFISDIGEDYPLGFLMDRVLDSCTRHQVACVDLRPLFDGRVEQDRLTLSFLDPHPTAIVHDMAIPPLLETFGRTWRSLHPERFKIPVQSARRGAPR